MKLLNAIVSVLNVLRKCDPGVATLYDYHKIEKMRTYSYIKLRKELELIFNVASVKSLQFISTKKCFSLTEVREILNSVLQKKIDESTAVISLQKLIRNIYNEGMFFFSISNISLIYCTLSFLKINL